MPIERFWEWAVYLNGPFSMRTREATLNGWLVQVIKSMMAPKGHKPKIADSMFPFDKVAQEYLKVPDKTPQGRKKATSLVGSQHRAMVLRKELDKKRRDWRAGRAPNAYGLYRGEVVKSQLPSKR